MNTPQRVTAFLEENKGQPFCDKCIELRLSLLRTVEINKVTQFLTASTAFVREPGKCSNCTRERVVTKVAAE